MKQNKFFKFSVVALSIVLIACSGGTEAGCPETDGRSLNVVVTTPMMGEFVSQVAEDNVNPVSYTHLTLPTTVRV